MSAPKGSLAALRAENGLWHELWLVALDEAYNAKDAKRRMDEIAGLAENQVVDVYFSYHPKMKSWAEGHIAAGTCEEAIQELRANSKETKKARAAQRADQVKLATMRAEEICAPPRDDAPAWMRPFMLGPAQFPKLDMDHETEPETAEESSALPVQSPLQTDLAEWIFLQHPDRLTFEKLLKRACNIPELGTFTKGDFQAAYGKVYETKANRPPASGWPLRHRYAERLKGPESAASKSRKPL
jgi:hypothetical protein